jgi:hypothetical protein
MHFKLSALGRHLADPVDGGVLGGVEDAVQAARAMLERYPACEAVEIFTEGRFVRDVERRPS